MMTARQYANKYPGQVVKLEAKHAKGLGLNGDEPIGIVVGFKIGKLGQPGSSKVAIYRDKYQLYYGLGPKTDTKYNAVIPEAPTRDKGIYFLSVDYLELVAPPKEYPPVVTYPDRCEKCGSPARNTSRYVVCSNDRCKTKDKALDTIGPIPKFYTLDKQGYVLCPVCQINELDFQSSYGGSQSRQLVCRKNGHNFNHTWKEGHKMNHRGTHRYIWKSGQLTNWIEKK